MVVQGPGIDHGALRYRIEPRRRTECPSYDIGCHVPALEYGRIDGTPGDTLVPVGDIDPALGCNPVAVPGPELVLVEFHDTPRDIHHRPASRDIEPEAEMHTFLLHCGGLVHSVDELHGGRACHKTDFTHQRLRPRRR